LGGDQPVANTVGCANRKAAQTERNTVRVCELRLTDQACLVADVYVDWHRWQTRWDGDERVLVAYCRQPRADAAKLTFGPAS